MLLPLITICSLLLAAAFAAVAWRVLSEERRRAEARVAALGALMDGTQQTTALVERADGTELFDMGREPVVARAPMTTLGIGFAVVVLIIVAIAMTGGRPPHPQPTMTSGTDGASTSRAAATAPLELISMRPERSGDALTVTGLVRNISTTPESGLIAVVFAFDRGGNFLSSARSPLTVVTLHAGDESGFRVTVPNAGAVSRYRISFRTEAGVVRHVDRRATTQAFTN